MDLKRTVLDFFYPRLCLGCGKEGSYFCPDCFIKIELSKSASCPYCKSRSFDGKICKNCRNYLYGFVSAVSYKEKSARKLIDSLKYNFVKEIARTLAFLIFKFLRDNPEVEFFKNPLDFLVVPIPLHLRRLRWRGFNQAEEIAKDLSPLLKIQLENNFLSRIHHTESQVELGVTERKLNIKNAFKINPLFSKEAAKKKIILVDDVATTLSTLEEAARVLKEGCTEKIWGLTVAKG
ncbi:MAG: double zinc ribbon domain-containing protein [Patescibacteria group bacterium]